MGINGFVRETCEIRLSRLLFQMGNTTCYKK
jgi:hypothetical protein